jgi:hypothetical protein
MHFLAGGGDGQTPLDGDEAAGLIPTWVATRGDVNQAEAGNIARGLLWVGRSRPSTADILEERFIRRLHERMLGDVWRWAGTYRTSNKNIGVDHWLIAEQLGQLLADCRYWLENGTTSPTSSRFASTIASPQSIRSRTGTAAWRARSPTSSSSRLAGGASRGARELPPRVPPRRGAPTSRRFTSRTTATLRRYSVSRGHERLVEGSARA